MEFQELKVSNPENGNIRIGELSPEEKLISNSHEGTISAPSDFYSKKYLSLFCKDFEGHQMLVTASYNKKTIVYYENNSTNVGGSKITGTLKVFNPIEALGINKEKMYNSKELAKTINMNRFLFFDKLQALSLVDSLKKFVAKVDSEIKDINNNQGNKNIAFSQTVETNFELKFIMECPVFSHTKEKRKFQVDILFDVRDRQVDFWLESTELKEIIDEETYIIIDLQLEKFKDIPVILID